MPDTFVQDASIVGLSELDLEALAVFTRGKIDQSNVTHIENQKLPIAYLAIFLEGRLFDHN